ncbi:hypothetical protein FGIG_06974 [Fasciola gigantica]|uniref:Uncharacterized protein n=1 Tax=Fasciola gigantica TaxID=46835 RepID=A0A504YZ06_FASGI|nr:hypothetical protein FGIG_06974 [Fasciola gigantica]
MGEGTFDSVNALVMMGSNHAILLPVSVSPTKLLSLRGLQPPVNSKKCKVKVLRATDDCQQAKKLQWSLEDISNVSPTDVNLSIECYGKQRLVCGQLQMRMHL